MTDYKYSPLDCPTCARGHGGRPWPIVCPDCGVDNFLKALMRSRERAREKDKERREDARVNRLVGALEAVGAAQKDVVHLAQDGVQVVVNRRSGGAAAALEREVRKGRAGWREQALAHDALLRRQEPHLSRKERAVRIAAKLGSVVDRTVYDALPKR